MHEPGPWTFRALWLVLPLTAGPALAGALDPLSDAVRLLATVMLWSLWGAVLAASLVPRAVSLTIVRLVAPSGATAALWAATVGAPDDPVGWQLGLALGSTVLAAGAALSPLTGDAFVNGSSYGPERRMPLRAPGAVLLGPVQVAWIVAVGGTLAGPFLLAAERWAAGLAALAVGWPLAVLAVRALHGLARRWVVFVPAGLVLHDPLSLADPVLFARRVVRSLGPAEAGTDAVDLTQRAPGVALQLDLREPLSIPRLGPRRAVRPVDTDRLLFTPTRPGALLTEAGSRRLPVG